MTEELSPVTLKERPGIQMKHIDSKVKQAGKSTRPAAIKTHQTAGGIPGGQSPGRVQADGAIQSARKDPKLRFLTNSERLKGPQSVTGRPTSVTRPLILTIGHSTRTIEAFLDLLQAHNVNELVDVRSIPRSRHNPQFNRDILPESLLRAGITYTHTKELGGLRHARPKSPNAAWRNTSFRGFADYMQTPEFAAAMKTLIQTARQKRTVIMCAEVLPWRCHRSLIADALTVAGCPVEHIMSATKTQPHSLTSFAKVEGRRITYPLVD